MIENRYCKHCQEGTIQYIADGLMTCSRCNHEEKV